MGCSCVGVAEVDPQVAVRDWIRTEQHHWPEKRDGHQEQSAADSGELPRLQVNIVPLISIFSYDN